MPIHGFLTTTSLWRVIEVSATAGEALVTSRLEVYRQPTWMRQWPYAHSVDITYRLADDALNLAHRGQYRELQMIPPGSAWRESFGVEPSGFTAVR